MIISKICHLVRKVHPQRESAQVKEMTNQNSMLQITMSKMILYLTTPQDVLREQRSQPHGVIQWKTIPVELSIRR